MPRDICLYLEDMLEAARRLVGYVVGMDRAAFGTDARTVDAVIRNLEILGEAAKRVPEDARVRRRSTGARSPACGTCWRTPASKWTSTS